MRVDPFDVLGAPARFDLDANELARLHRELSRALHPDKYVSAPAAERRMALSRAVEVNEAFRALRDPVRRAEALAVRHGIATGDGNEPRPSQNLLMEMMEGREELAEAARESALDRVVALGNAMRVRERAAMDALARAFESEPTPERVLPPLGELRYVRRFLDEVAAFEETLAV
jgi:molecular chaperone HscB